MRAASCVKVYGTGSAVVEDWMEMNHCDYHCNSNLPFSRKFYTVEIDLSNNIGSKLIYSKSLPVVGFST